MKTMSLKGIFTSGTIRALVIVAAAVLVSLPAGPRAAHEALGNFSVSLQLGADLILASSLIIVVLSAIQLVCLVLYTVVDVITKQDSGPARDPNHGASV